MPYYPSLSAVSSPEALKLTHIGNGLYAIAAAPASAYAYFEGRMIDSGPTLPVQVILVADEGGQARADVNVVAVTNR